MRMDFSLKVLQHLFVFVLFFSAQITSAALLQIIHTNDLHSHFENYAALKATIDKIKYDAAEKGIDTLIVDAGDFSEGTQYFLAQKGELSWQSMNELGYDAVVLGNHDYLTGPIGLERIITNSKPEFSLLAANFHSEKKYKNTFAAVQPRVRLAKAGSWVTVMGVTTDEYMYTWRAGKGVIKPPKTAAAPVPSYRKDSAFVIAVTHLGVEADLKFVRETWGIDLIIGGHSHDEIRTPKFEKALDGRKVPIVQAGEHGKFVGDLLVDLVPGRPLRIVHYKLTPVDRDGPKNSSLQALVQEARQSLNKTYPGNWLETEIGYTEVPMLRPTGGNSVWGDIVGEGMRLVTKADVSFNSADFFGQEIPPGPVTREKLIQYYPRVFEFYNFTTGWNVWTAEVEGWVLKYLLEDAVNQGFDVSLHGASFKAAGEKGKQTISNIKVGSGGLRLFRTYKVAMPEGIGRLFAQNYMHAKTLQPLQSSKVSIWAAAELQLRKMGGYVRAF